MSVEARNPVQFDDLYRDLILDHYRRPRHKEPLADATVAAEGLNPSCGDEIRVELRVEDGKVAGIAFGGMGCSISQASGSMMMDKIVGMSIDDIRDIIYKFKLMMSIEEGDNPVDPDRPGSVLGDLEALQGVRKFPVRIKCADLAWTTLADALDQA